MKERFVSAMREARLCPVFAVVAKDDGGKGPYLAVTCRNLDTGATTEIFVGVQDFRKFCAETLLMTEGL